MKINKHTNSELPAKPKWKEGKGWESGRKQIKQTYSPRGPHKGANSLERRIIYKTKYGSHSSHETRANVKGRANILQDKVLARTAHS